MAYFVPVPRNRRFCIDIFSDAVAGLLLEDLHQIAAADKELPGKRIDGEVAVQMFIDVMQDFRDLPVGGACFDIAEGIG